MTESFTGASFTAAELLAFLDEALPPADMARIEQALRGDATLAERLVALSTERDAGAHSLGEIWRRGRLTCPSREQLGSYLLGALEDGQAQFIQRHLELVACRYCNANLADLASRRSEQPATVDGRRRKYFQSSAGRLRRAGE